RITMFARTMASKGWQFDVVASPVFFLGDRALHAKLGKAHGTPTHLQVYLTHPGIVGAMRYALHRRRRRSTPVDAGPEGSTLQRSSGTTLYRLLRWMHSRYDQAFARIGDPDWILPAVMRGLRLQSARSYGVVYA